MTCYNSKAHWYNATCVRRVGKECLRAETGSTFVPRTKYSRSSNLLCHRSSVSSVSVSKIQHAGIIITVIVVDKIVYFQPKNSLLVLTIRHCCIQCSVVEFIQREGVCCLS